MYRVSLASITFVMLQKSLFQPSFLEDIKGFFTFIQGEFI
jgi:hypothetical protein